MSVEVTRLPSGLAVVTDNMPHLQTASLGVWVGAGSRDELPKEHGISHLLEHMAFKGTRRRSARQIAEEIEAVGGDINAGTSVESTAYYTRVLKADVPLALDVLSDILSEPAFDPNELIREQNVILQEIGAAEDTPDDIVFDHLQEIAFPGQPVGRSILGTPDSVRSFKQSDLREYLNRNYCGPDMVVVATGAVEHDAVVDQAAKLFSGFEGSGGPTPQPARFASGARLEPRDLEQMHIALALEGLPQGNADLFSLQVFSSAVGGGMSSRLFQEVRENRGLCYSIYTYHAPYSDTGTFVLYAGTDPGDTADLLSVAMDEIEAAASNITQVEIDRAKAQMRAGLMMALESSSARAQQLANHMLIHGRPIPLAELSERIDRVTVESTRAAGQALLARSRPAIALIGARRGLDAAARIVDRLSLKAA